jgi:hypothetical protein
MAGGTLLAFTAASGDTRIHTLFMPFLQFCGMIVVGQEKESAAD